MAQDRDIGGIRCGEVLEHLAEYLDDEVSKRLRECIEAHLKECDWCERFGGSYAATVSALRQNLCDADPLEEALRDRLARRLSSALFDDE